MILWDDFDKRATKVLCDKCQQDIAPQLYEALKHPWRSKVKAICSSALNVFRGQWAIQLGHTRWVLTRFHVNATSPSFLFQKMKEHKDWDNSSTVEYIGSAKVTRRVI